MGYGLAGFRMVGSNDIDPDMMDAYRANLGKPEGLYLTCPVSEVAEGGIPPQLRDLDVLDGSPPCSTFSMAGLRERAWGRRKRFREGQAEQTLDMLFFDFVDLANPIDYRRDRVGTVAQAVQLPGTVDVAARQCPQRRHRRRFHQHAVECQTARARPPQLDPERIARLDDSPVEDAQENRQAGAGFGELHAQARNQRRLQLPL